MHLQVIVFLNLEKYLKLSYFSFEPSKKNFDILKKTKNIKNLRLHNVALSNKNGYSNFYENKWEYTSSLLPLNNSEYKKRLEKIFKYRGINEIQSKYLVKTHTLDYFIKIKILIYRYS